MGGGTQCECSLSAVACKKCLPTNKETTGVCNGSESSSTRVLLSSFALVSTFSPLACHHHPFIKLPLHFAGSKSLSLPLLAKETFKAIVKTSAKTCDGLPDLNAAILRLAGAPELAAGGVSWSVNQRQAEALVRAHEALMAVVESIKADMPQDCWTIDLRSALLALGEVTGQGLGEEVLDSIFSKFCIGK